MQRYFAAWRDDELWARINHHLLMAAREAEGREASPSAGVIASQSAKTTESGSPRGFDTGKKIKGRKRHVLTDTRCWVVERTLAWLNRNRRLAKDFEASVATAQAWLFIASVQLLTRRLIRYWKSISYYGTDFERYRAQRGAS